MCVPRWCLDNPQWASLLHLSFYKDPVELECCNSDAYLGFTLNVEKGTFCYIIPPHAGQNRSALSAGSTHLKLSGLRSRLHLLYAGTYPPSLREGLVTTLIDRFVEKGFTKADLLPLAAAVKARFQNKQPIFGSCRPCVCVCDPVCRQFFFLSLSSSMV